MRSSIVETYDLHKTYRNGVQALRGVSIKIREGEIHTLLGKNGAGKTTFIRIISTQLLPSSGEAYVYGYDVVREADEIRKKIVVVPQEGKTYNFTTPWHEVYFAAKIWGYRGDDARRRTREVLEQLELWEHKDKLCINLSGGLKQRVLLARALVTGADLLILDEPTIGVDPLGRRMIWDIIREMSGMGKTIILTTHYIDEAEELSDRITIIDEGRVVAGGSVDELLSMVKGKIRIYIYGDDVETRLTEWKPYTLNGKWVIDVENEEDMIRVVREALKLKYRVILKPPDLEDVFIKLVGREYE